MSKDPVCGMAVEPSQAAGHSEFEGVSYDFCCPACQQRFDADPRQFTTREAPRARVPCCGFGMGMVRHTIQRGSA